MREKIKIEAPDENTSILLVAAIITIVVLGMGLYSLI